MFSSGSSGYSSYGYSNTDSTPVAPRAQRARLGPYLTPVGEALFGIGGAADHMQVDIPKFVLPGYDGPAPAPDGMPAPILLRKARVARRARAHGMDEGQIVALLAKIGALDSPKKKKRARSAPPAQVLGMVSVPHAHQVLKRKR